MLYLSKLFEIEARTAPELGEYRLLGESAHRPWAWQFGDGWRRAGQRCQSTGGRRRHTGTPPGPRE
eukprot:156913-Prorocentrum_minimum.AAC.2